MEKMNGRLMSVISLLAMTFWLKPCIAASDLAPLQKLIDAGQGEKAYQLALPQLPDREGDPAFDFVYGMAAIDSGHVNEGIYALERVLFARPKNLRARVELARGYFLVGEDRSARREFERVLATNPPAAVNEKIQYFLNAIRLRETEYKTTSSAYVEYGVGHDSNLNSAPADAGFFSPLLGPGTLSSSGVELHDTFGELALGGQINHPVKPGVSLFAELNGRSRNNANQDGFEADSVDVQAGVKFRKEKNQYKILLEEQRYFVGDLENRNLHGIGAEWTRPLDSSTQLTLSGQRSDLLYPKTSIQNATAYTAAATLVHGLSLPYSPILFGSALLGKDDSFNSDEIAKSVAQRKYAALRGGLLVTLTPQTSATASLLVQASKYGGENILFFETRQDQFYSFDLSVTHLLKEQWKVKGSLGYSEGHSNIDIYEYDRLVGEVAIRYEFQ